MILYGLKQCDTCRKALKLLEEVEFADVRKDGVPVQTLSQAYDLFGDALINKRSTTWRELSQEQREIAPLDLLTANPTVMKRPLIVTKDTLYLGWTKDVQAALLGE